MPVKQLRKYVVAPVQHCSTTKHHAHCTSDNTNSTNPIIEINFVCIFYDRKSGIYNRKFIRPTRTLCDGDGMWLCAVWCVVRSATMLRSTINAIINTWHACRYAKCHSKILRENFQSVAGCLQCARVHNGWLWQSTRPRRTHRHSESSYISSRIMPD